MVFRFSFTMISFVSLFSDCSGLEFEGNTFNDYSSNAEETLLTPPEVIYLEAPDKRKEHFFLRMICLEVH